MIEQSEAAKVAAWMWHVKCVAESTDKYHLLVDCVVLG